MNARMFSPPELPPPARGRGPSGYRGAKLQGITPACAGKIVGLLRPALPTRNYPRLRGEDPTASISFLMARELPPLARGRLSPSSGMGAWNGITPACAGKMLMLDHLRAHDRNYPRLRGEDRISARIT